MKADWSAIERNRQQFPGSRFETNAGDRYGWFCFRTPRGATLRCMVVEDPDSGWEHVSVSVTERREEKPSRCPTWGEMCYVKQAFWSDDETVVQFHPRQSEYVNNHEFVLHLWKRIGFSYKLPPTNFV